jgi:hypothetical protein
MVKMARLPPQKNIHSDAEMDQFMRTLFESVITKVGKQLKEKLQEVIQKEVYDKGTPKEYDRQYKRKGFYTAWYASDAGNLDGEIVSAIQYSESDQSVTMSHNPSEFVHGSNHWIHGDDIRPYLADIIMNGRFTGSPHVGKIFDRSVKLQPADPIPWWFLPRDFWTPFLTMLNNGEADSLIKLELNRMGINLVPA